MLRPISMVLLAAVLCSGAGLAQESLIEPELPARERGVSSPDAVPGSDEAVGGAFSYLRIAGSNHKPRVSGQGYSYGGFGCLGHTAGGNFYVHDVQLPDGAEINFLRSYFNDTSASAIGVSLWSYDSAGNGTQILSTTSVGNGGYHSILSNQISYVVDSFNETYSIAASIPVPGGGILDFCGVRIAFVSQGIFADSFESGDTGNWDTSIE